MLALDDEGRTYIALPALHAQLFDAKQSSAPLRRPAMLVVYHTIHCHVMPKRTRFV